MLSKKAKYGIRSLLYLARHRHGGAILIKKIAEDEKIPKKFLEAVLLELKNAGILRSKTGRGGGYALNRELKEIRLSQIIRLLHGPLALAPCVSQTAYTACSDCMGERKCPIREVLKQVHASMLRVLDQTTLEHLLKDYYRLNAIDEEFGIHI